VLISNAYAQAAASGADSGGGLMGLIPLLLMFVVLWFLMIRPQMKKAKEHNAMVTALQKGDEVVTQGGIAGRISKLSDGYVTLEIAQFKDQPVEVLVQKNSVGTLLPKGSLKEL